MSCLKHNGQWSVHPDSSQRSHHGPYNAILTTVFNANDGLMVTLQALHLYVKGRGVEQDYGKAMEWYLKASDAGSATAKFYISVMYDKGRGVEPDNGRAME
ncbi:hypothetical protein EC968_002640 [Mortierella alpina]|nr:hypothetical protein EC968_002640 [Mortierella alpina]